MNALLVRYEEAVRMEATQKAVWEEQNRNTNSGAREKWIAMDTAPYRFNGKWTSVFLMAKSTRKP